MRYRQLDADGDMVFGAGSLNFFVNDTAAVGQAICTRLKLIQGEWFLDQTVGMAYATKVFVEGGRFTADRAAQMVILGTQGVIRLDSYASTFQHRNWSVQATVDSIYGSVRQVVEI